MIVENNRVVSIQYVLKDDAGNVLHDNTNFAAEEYLHGAGNILPGLELALQDMKAGQEIDVIIPPEYAYGPVEASLILDVSKEDLPGFEGIAEGDQVTLFDGTEVCVLEIYDDHLVADANHPLAGKTLHYTVRIAAIREALSEEILQGEPATLSGGSCGPAGCC
jgi:FKBP-type peptidyl-prolyl cis-trans isomerase SlyD